ncbi:hypothetical protein AX769_16115 [Frondihabitans sp. PAMC 28766]|uniref:DUF6611 family protein n=1 Tax=Frondihabitans sp. PAMC 28766 TaxID=1795630 RepID=UPI00078B8E1D|nr:DUF6611 family protein [Frondihabitans sp. PAMC 28766]AMM21377.1 hypothetical protein AX769_16115 [Frondihabitans sp. PAMC 28766]
MNGRPPSSHSAGIADGQHLWGRVDYGVSGPGALRRIRLTVYAPGTNASERRLLRVWHAWPIVSVAWGVLMMVLVSVRSLGPECVAGVVAYALATVILVSRTRRLRHASRRIAVSTIEIGGRQRREGDASLLGATLQRLGSLEHEVRAGLLDPIGFELRWAEAYQLIPAR